MQKIKSYISRCNSLTRTEKVLVLLFFVVISNYLTPLLIHYLLKRKEKTC